MWNKTRVTELLGIDYPIIQGPFGGRFSTVKLASAVSNLGGLGSFGMNYHSPDQMLEIDAQLKAATSNPYNLNIWVPLDNDPIQNFNATDFEMLKRRFQPYFDELGIPLPDIPEHKSQNFEAKVEALLRAQPAVVSFIFGIPPAEVIKEMHKSGIKLMAAATTAEEAMLIEESGIDMVVASGKEAGGHRPSFIKSALESLTCTKLLVHQVVDQVKIPVIAAGGIASSADVQEALKLGASAVQIGTAFLATEESGAMEIHKEKLRSNPPLETQLTEVFTGRLARSITNTLSKDFEGQSGFAPFPIQSTFLGPLRTAAIEQGRYDLVSLWSGKSERAHSHQTTKELFDSLISI